MVGRVEDEVRTLVVGMVQVVVVVVGVIGPIYGVDVEQLVLGINS